eukprot:1548824-Alexandrium_andersonii.AAC.1
MSASLVGSEMCIRDSRMAVWRWVAADGVEKVRVLSRTVAVAVDQAERAVSYTHLTLPTICSV